MGRLYAFLVILFSASAIFAFDGEIAGKIGEINKSTGEIVVSTGSSMYRIDMGDKLYVRVKGSPVIMRATFPMLTIVKCRLSAENKSSIKEIVSGMIVYKYKPGIEKEEEVSAQTGDESVNRNRRRMAKADTSLSSVYYETVWKITAPGGNPEIYYVILKADGSIGYSYKDAENLQFDNADSWRMEGDTLVIIWTNGYSTEKFQMMSGGRVFSGKKTSKNYEGEKNCTIEKIR